MKINKTLKIVISCAVLLLFTSSSIAAAELTQNEPLNHTTNTVQLLPGQIMLPGGYIVNQSDREKNVIKRGIVNFTMPKTDSMVVHINITKNLTQYLMKLVNFTPADEVLSVSCNGYNCTYEVIQKNNTSASQATPSTHEGWQEDAIFSNYAGTVEYTGIWHVPSAPVNKSGQIVFYFIDLENILRDDILQPVIEWNNGYDINGKSNTWQIVSVSGIWPFPNYNYGPNLPANAGDIIWGGVWQVDYRNMVWEVDTYDAANYQESILVSSMPENYFPVNQVALEVHNLNTCDQFPGSADFYHLYIDGLTPSWGIEPIQTGCGLGVNIVSPSEVQLIVNPNDTIGVSRNSTSTFYLRNSNDAGYADLTFAYGNPGDIPLAGDWIGQGEDTIGVYRPGTSTFYLRNNNSAGTPDNTFQFGNPNPNYIPIAGDWNGDGITTIGIYDKSTSIFYLRNSNNLGFADLTFQFGDS